MPRSETEYLPERWGPEWQAQMKSFTAKLPTVTKENAEEFITEHDLLFRNWDDLDWVDGVPPRPGFHRKPQPEARKTPFHR